MKVLYCSELFPPYVGGIEICATGLLPALMASGHDIMIVTSHDTLDLPDTDTFAEIPVLRFQIRDAIRTGNVAELLRIGKEIAEVREKFRPDLVHLDGVGTSALVSDCVFGGNSLPMLVSLHQEMLRSHSGRGESLVEKVLRDANWVTAVADSVLEQARRLVPEIINRSEVVYAFTDTPPAKPSRRPVDPPRILCLGRLVPQKGIDIAVRAFADVIRPFPTALLVIAGDGPDRAKLENLARESGVENAVEFTGMLSREAVWRQIDSASIVLMPSRHEGLPLTAMEAARMARPIVASPVGGLGEAIDHGRTGLLVDTGNPDGFANAMISMLEQPALATRMGKAGKKLADERFDKARCVRAYDRLYRRLAGLKAVAQ